MSTNFVDYLIPEMANKLEEIYGDNFAELVDYEMRKIVKKKSEYLMRFGLTLYEFTDITQGGFFHYDPTGLGYLYGHPISMTWEWANATINDDKETLERLTLNEAVEEAKYKSKFIEYYSESLLLPARFMDKHLLAAQRNNGTRRFNNIKTFMGEQDAWFLK